MVFSDTLHTLRLRNYFTRTFIPRFQALEKAASQTRLIIMLWASQSTELWCTSCKQIVGELERLGHTVFYNEQLGVSTAMRRKKGVEYTASDTLDLIVAVQPAFDPIGDVPDFEEFIVADSKMLLFIDQAAPDRPLYQQSLNEMSVRYNNVDSFKFPGDLLQRTLLDKIVAKSKVMQMAKYRAVHYGKNWGLGFSPDLVVTQSQITPVASPYNLLEVFRLHREELETLIDATTLFILAYVNHMGKMTLRNVWNDMKLDAAQIQPRMMRLQCGNLLAETNGQVSITGEGKRLLSTLGL